MATVEPKFSGVSPAQPQGAYFTVSIAQGAFSDAASTAGGRVSPCGATDFATAPTTLAESTRLSHIWHMTLDKDDKPLIITDGVLNVMPNVKTKMHILKNVINFSNRISIQFFFYY